MSGQSLWSHPDLDERNFVALLKVLSLRHPKHIEKPVYPKIPFEHDDFEERYLAKNSGVDSMRADQFSDENKKKLKERFLDRLAELIALERGERFVACATMLEKRTGVTVLVARNTSLDRAELNFLYSCAANLKRLATKSLSGRDRNKVEDSLWSRILAHTRHQIELWYIRELERSFAACKDVIGNAEGHLSTEQLNPLQQLQANILSEDHNLLVCLAYGIRHSRVLGMFLLESEHSNVETRKLFVNICFLARPRSAFIAFKMAAEFLSNFRNLKISCITGKATIRYKPPPNPRSLHDTLKLLQFDMSDDNIRKYIHPKLSVAEAKEKFKELHEQPRYIHAEIQMALHIQSLSLDEVFFPYIGCSNYSCILCETYLTQAFGKRMTRGCQESLETEWMIDTKSKLSLDQAVGISKTTLHVQDFMKNILRSPFENSFDFYRDIRALYLKTQSQPSIPNESTMDGASQRHPSPSPDSPSPKPPSSSPETSTGVCFACDNTTSRKCCHCRREWFCSRSCEENDFTHIFECNNRVITTAHRLFRDISADDLPKHPGVLTDFGFRRLYTFQQQSSMVGLYQGLQMLGVSPKTLHDWQRTGCLRSKIIQTYEQLPRNERGGYYPWFLENKDILANAQESGDVPKNPLAPFEARARLYLQPSDQTKKIEDLTPASKHEAFWFLMVAMMGWHPAPEAVWWYNFGFCVCHDERAESELSVIYRILLFGNQHSQMLRSSDLTAPSGLCTFEEFWKAYDSNTLIQLMDSKGLRDMRMSSALKHLEPFLTVKGHPSVWRLKQYLALDDNKAVQGKPPPAVWVDYGFINCDDPVVNQKVLRENYRKVLEKADPLELHAACIKGELFSFVTRYVKVDSKYKNCFKNLYPLAEL